MGFGESIHSRSWRRPRQLGERTHLDTADDPLSHRLSGWHRRLLEGCLCPDDSRGGCLHRDGCLIAAVRFNFRHSRNYQMECSAHSAATSWRWLHLGRPAPDSDSWGDTSVARRREILYNGSCGTGVSGEAVGSARVGSKRVDDIKISDTQTRLFQFIRAMQSDSGSAIIEFVMLAVPLMIPVVIYLGVVHENSVIKNDLHNLARQSARAFITSPGESYESARLQSIVQVFETRILRPDGITEIPTVTVECSASPCLTPDSRVKVTASLTHIRDRFSGIFRFITAPRVQFSASDVQIVDAWR